MSRENPNRDRLYKVLRAQKGKLMPMGDAFTDAYGSTEWNYNTMHQWKLAMDRHYRHLKREASTTQIGYRLDPANQALPSSNIGHWSFVWSWPRGRMLWWIWENGVNGCGCYRVGPITVWRHEH